MSHRLTPTQKAIELILKYHGILNESDMYGDYTKATKESALAAVDEILNEFPSGILDGIEYKRKEYWQEVSEKIEQYKVS